MKKTTLKIDGMRCQMCEAHVCDALRRALPQARAVKADHRQGTMTFVIEEESDFAPGIEAIQVTGYRVLSWEKSPAKKTIFGWR